MQDRLRDTPYDRGMLPWWFWIFPLALPVVMVGLALLVQWDKRRRGE